MNHVDSLSIRRCWDQYSMDHVDRVFPLEGIGISTAWIMLIEPVPLEGIGISTTWIMLIELVSGRYWDQHSMDHVDRLCLLQGIGISRA